MIFTLAVLLKSSIIFVCSLACVALFRKRAASWKHQVLFTTLVLGSLVLPFWWIVPEWRVIPWSSFQDVASPASQSARILSDDQASGVSSFTPAQIPLPISRKRTLTFVAAVVWAAGSIALLATLLASSLRLRRIATSSTLSRSSLWTESAAAISREYGLRRRVAILQGKTDSPITWGFFKPKVLLPADSADWNAERARAALYHELAHIERSDWLMNNCVELAKVVYWFNPLLWLICSRLKLESEIACDDSVLVHGIAPEVYARQLLDVVERLQIGNRESFDALAMSRPSTLERRFTAMLNANTNRSPIPRSVRFATFFLTLCVALLIVAVTASARQIELPARPAIGFAVPTPIVPTSTGASAAQLLRVPQLSQSQSITAAAEKPYLIRTGDTVAVIVYQEPSASGHVIVRANGTISVPLLNDIPAAGLSPTELKQIIEARLKKYLDDPHVTIAITRQ